MLSSNSISFFLPPYVGSPSDSDKCDRQLTQDNTTVISRRFFRFDIDPATYNPRVTVLSNNSIRIYDGDKMLTCHPGDL